MEKLSKQEADTFLENVGEGMGYVGAYVKQEIETVKLDAAEKVSIASSNFITVLVLSAIGGLVWIFASISLGFYLGAIMGSDAVGFLLVAVLYFLVFILIYAFKKPLITDRIVRSVIRLFFDKEKQDEEN